MGSQYDPATRVARLKDQVETLAEKAARLKKQHQSPRATLRSLTQARHELLAIEVSYQGEKA